MTALLLKRASASRPSGEWNDDDFDVLADGVVGDQIIMPADLRRLHKYMQEIEGVDSISDEMRAVVEELWPDTEAEILRIAVELKGHAAELYKLRRSIEERE